MATSGTYTITKTANSLIKSALQNLGAIAADETPTNSDIQLGIDGLNQIIKELEGPPNYFVTSKKMWQRETGLLTLKSQNSYSLKPSGGDLDIQIPVEILTAVLRHTTSNSDTPMTVMDLAQYQSIGNKESSVTPTALYYEKRLDEGKMYLDGVPSSAAISGYKISFVYRQPLEIISAQTNEIDIEPNYYNVLEFNLSRYLAPKFGVRVTSDILMMAREAEVKASSFQREDANVHFEPGRDE